MVYPVIRQCGDNLAQIVADELAKTIRARIQIGNNGASRATVALAGGSTPRACYQILSRAPLNWERVVVLPTDERCVPEDHPRSNAGMLRETLFAEDGLAQRAQYQSLVVGETPVQLDAVLLGMGTDSHIASIFPGTKDVPGNTVMETTAPDGEKRVTLSLAAIAAASRVLLMLQGEDKQTAFENATHQSPVAKLIAAVKVEVFCG